MPPDAAVLRQEVCFFQIHQIILRIGKYNPSLFTNNSIVNCKIRGAHRYESNRNRSSGGSMCYNRANRKMLKTTGVLLILSDIQFLKVPFDFFC